MSFPAKKKRTTSNKHEEEPKSCQSSKWANLPHDCLINILCQLTLRKRWAGPMFVCKSWFAGCKDPYLNSVFDMESYFQSQDELPQWETHEFEEKMDYMLMSVIDWSKGSLVDIRTRHCSNRSLNFVADRCPNLQTLSIKKCPGVTDESMSRIASRCPNLRELDISCSFKISHLSLVMIGKNCPNLKILKRNMPVGGYRKWPQRFSRSVWWSYIHAIAKNMPNLEHLELQNYAIVLNEYLDPICEGCLNLQYLDIAGKTFYDEDFGISTSKLKNLKTFIGPTPLSTTIGTRRIPGCRIRRSGFFGPNRVKHHRGKPCPRHPAP